jgi:hypothetical protein
VKDREGEPRESNGKMSTTKSVNNRKEREYNDRALYTQNPIRGGIKEKYGESR